LGFHILNFTYIPIALVFMFLIAFLFTALGTAIASLLKDMNAFPLIINFVIMPLFFLSGALFPVENLPSFLAVIIRINPLSYGVDGVRGALTTSSFGLPMDFAIILAWIVVINLIGSYLFSKIEV
jgi:ABC-2 type transport system permease protein